jgi:hypothetical protein
MSHERKVCAVCGANPCYGICPNNDPFGGDQAAENADYEFNAQYDHRLGMFSPAEQPGYRDDESFYDHRHDGDL